MEIIQSIPVKSLSDFKSRMKAGVKLHTIHHLKFGGREASGEIIYTDEDRGIATVEKVQSNAIVVTRHKADGTPYGSWFHYPKASECRIESGKLIWLDEIQKIDGSHQTVPSLTYTIIE